MSDEQQSQAEGAKQSDLGSRVITGVAAALFIVVIASIGGFPLRFVVVAVVAVMAWELSGVLSASRPEVRTLSLLGGLSPTVLSWVLSTSPLTAVLVSVTLVLCGGVYFAHKAGPQRELFETPALALVFAGLLGLSLLEITRVTDGGSLLLWFLFVVAGSDTGAYFGGRKFGGEKLAPLLSPQKTISGALSGLLGAVVVSLVFAAFSDLPVGMFSALLIAAVSQVGDLAGSSVKRVYGVKDYGSILPGHGGVFDRVVAHAVAAPIFLALL